MLHDFNVSSMTPVAYTCIYYLDICFAVLSYILFPRTYGGSLNDARDRSIHIFHRASNIFHDLIKKTATQNQQCQIFIF